MTLEEQERLSELQWEYKEEIAEEKERQRRQRLINRYGYEENDFDEESEEESDD